MAQILILEVNFKSSRISVIRVAQYLGLTPQNRRCPQNHPDQRTPTKRDWERLVSNWESLLDARISKLEF
jgi:MerR family redox-sensitive transcriptional activator SoxR